jgi:type VI secretion system protein ImpJ
MNAAQTLSVFEDVMTQPAALPDLPYGVQWSEGLLLSPQHLQQNDRFWHERIRYLTGCANPDFVGVRWLELDEGRLGKGQVVVRSLECVLDDGTPIVVRKDRDRPVELDLTARLKDAGERVRVSLVLALAGEASAARGSMNRRYDSLPGTAAVDENTGTTAVAVARLKPIVRLDGDWTPGANLLAGCPLFELERTALGTFRRTDYHPPMASLSASAFMKEKALRQRAEALRDAVRMKLREIAQAGEAASPSAASGDAFLALAARTLAMILPGLDVLGLGADVAPRALYVALAHAAGQMASLDPLPDPPVLPPYDHIDCQPGFDAAMRFIETRVAAISPSFERLPFERDGRAQFSRHLPVDIGHTLLIEVVPAAGQSRTDIDRWFDTCSIGHPALLDELDSRRMPGASAALSNERRTGMNPAALYYEIRNAAFDFTDGKRDVFSAGEPLAIRSVSRHVDAPAAIVLYREPSGVSRREAARGDRAREQAAHESRAHEHRGRMRVESLDEWQALDPADVRPRFVSRSAPERGEPGEPGERGQGGEGAGHDHF